MIPLALAGLGAVSLVGKAIDLIGNSGGKPKMEMGEDFLKVMEKQMEGREQLMKLQGMVERLRSEPEFFEQLNSGEQAELIGFLKQLQFQFLNSKGHILGGEVDGVSVKDGKLVLSMGGEQVGVDDVISYEMLKG